MNAPVQWGSGWRERIWQELDREWDVVIVGGGITGAAILGAAVQRGWSALLVEQRDFAWGASSRSSKLVHGGLRYLKEGKIGLTRASARERKLLHGEYPDLIKPLGFSLATYEGAHPGPWQYKLGLSVYDLLAGQWSHERLSPEQMRLIVPNLRREGLNGGFRFQEAVTDDARLVLELIRRAVAAGASAINYVRAEELTRKAGRVTGLALRDTESDRVISISARFVINATGAWTDRLREQAGGTARIRPLRGSHLVLPQWRLPLPQAVSKPHPWDGRPVFALPWEGATVVGTTDEDHEPSLDDEPRITSEEAAYLMAFLHDLFPSLGISHEDVVSCFAGVRPVIASGEADPSKESRDHVVWEENGLVTVTGGKLTTFEINHRRAEVAREHFRKAGVERLVTIVEGDAHTNVTRLKGPIDVVFIDADKSGYVDYLNKLLPLVRPGGLILAHNLDMAPEYVKTVTSNPALETVFYMQGNQLGITLKKR